ncbi:MAG: ANTAR domain-containing protein [Methylophaga sp.]
MGSDTAVNTIVISEHPEISERLKKTLAGTSYRVIFECTTLQQLLNTKWHVKPALLVAVMGNCGSEVLSKFKLIKKQFPLPVVIFTQDDRDDAIELAIQAGVSAYVFDGFREDRVLPILCTAIARFQQYQSMQKQIQELKTALADRKIIDRAKGLIMAQRQCSEDEAYRLLRTSAMNQNMRLVQLARNILAAASLLEPTKQV